MKLDLKTVSIWIVGLVMAGGFAVLPAIYNVGLAVAPPPPVPAQVHAPPLIRAALWANAQGRGAPHLVPLTEWSLFGFVSCNLYVEFTVEKPEHDNDARDDCFDRQAGFMLAGQLSRQHIEHAGIKPSPRYALSQTATTANLTRTWDIDKLIDTLATEGYYGHGWMGVYAASEGFFGKQASDLSAVEAATLAMQIPFPRMTDPWTRMEAAITRRNALLQRMHRNGAVDDQSLNAALLAPITVQPLPANWQSPTWDSPRSP